MARPHLTPRTGEISSWEQKFHREIDLPEPPPVIPDGEYSEREVERTKQGVLTRERRREGAVMIIKTSQVLRFDGDHGEEEHTLTEERRIPAVISFDWLLDQVEVEPDTDVRMPWDDQDGWEHTLESFSDYFGGTYEDFRKSRGRIQSSSYLRSERVLVNDNSYCGDSVERRINYLRSKGASKQVAREKIAADDRRYIDQIVEWYDNGYDCVYVKLEVNIGGKEYEDSCGGFEADYEDEARQEIARNVASELTSDGYIVKGYAKEATYRENRKQAKLQQLKRNLNMFNWEY